MDNEDSILAGSMSPQFLKELSDYLYGLITGKYQPRRQHSRQPAGGGLTSNEIVLDYEEETRALDARNRGLDPMTASVLRSPARSQPRRLHTPTRVARPRPQPGPALTQPGTAQTTSQASSPEELRTVQGPPLARRLPTLFQDAPRRLPQTSEMVESSRTLPRDELIPSQMGSQPTRTRQGPQRVMLLTNQRRPASTSPQGAPMPSRTLPEITQQRRPQNPATSSETSQSSLWATTTTSPRIATNLSVALQNRTRTPVSGASFSRRRNVRQGISRRRPSSARRSSSKRRSEGTIRRSRSSGEI
ncbi:hypothetical protein TELCIR_05129 [Teladorsagia circumcincta]|uniref:Uncharacterized protein n=1 Tax=Teladorsagia circumcincta TaxID=45464 RepID=A0A2G9URM4_TELCI|nr:hypothetical protein TELCIR_05129 [Teladorsagia circumcincta]